MISFSSQEAKWRVTIKRVLRLEGFCSGSINNLKTCELETLITPFQKALKIGLTKTISGLKKLDDKLSTLED
ncbi:MAG: hypothetical protein A2487_13495 [Candidatus Raymondbacteria bacterium RifOxyC12_full_50_8]|uniref:Uncharacterized protein n=1 Tax=Candidatus Raymondbacteria bacterium RIFOXYD12_FULL_49_13 TaxID=1817890 RepID=A0A1F7F7V6_UNCRA|nr:MAG: hypothetical protein A2248_13605 [Candidatus Raymondbacteria bacterium RIFOXYA2_FULL_49_16]OGJ95161.1 MAG: hypothetical protein A2350_09460 [Candidatus Raymondbacteria bacterium RifOxyB12_full_50_8]OGK00373.1 MAG: hypothetical protein A2487_13495 [Candidatus Raymondbacteria bacterium RifOxyC12_full_50_8]OGK02711.1 MAG: hypothetical protein A2519_09620 [Candidatus Raymondbacteria bacterium RIFOXYD12_FULL_49_13]OGP42357.1 MAG: hypothetical protein A2324_20290 [Candidatus Raymondbacteria b